MAAESSLTAYLEQMFSKRFDAMQSMVERLPGGSTIGAIKEPSA
uniref:Uncharacterized protein n=1 Tax=Brassica campestris TaxID=3711 RepID=A0A3P5YUL8_BRACM|nr:unnamed protein product [Brassica rapa]